ncbi:MAG: nucleotidyltransferase family protein, partial [Candidatus Binatia bacterium]
MKAGIIAAGHGARLHASGITTPKPLVMIAGRSLLARTIDAAKAAGASSVACIVNAETDRVRRVLEHEDFGLPIEIVQRTTASSAESFLALRQHLEDAPFLLLTVDAVLAPDATSRLIARAAELPDAAGVLGVTTVVDDEKPLWVELDRHGRIRSLGDPMRAHHVTAGVYFLKPLVYALADAARPGAWSAFRMFLASLLEHDHTLYGWD